MQKTLPLLAVLLIGCASTVPLPEPVTLSQRVSCWVEITVDGVVRGGGTANPIGPDTFLTAAHVVEDIPWLDVKFTVDKHPVVEIIYLEGIDAAIIRTAGPHGIPVWPMDDRQVAPGEILILSGWGYGEHRFKEHRGAIVQEHSSGQIAPGDSGGALLDADGDIVAIAVAVDRRPFADHHALVVPIAAILAQMRSQGLIPPEAL
jgi:hypothetical protein